MSEPTNIKKFQRRRNIKFIAELTGVKILLYGGLTLVVAIICGAILSIITPDISERPTLKPEAPVINHQVIYDARYNAKKITAEYLRGRMLQPSDEPNWQPPWFSVDESKRMLEQNEQNEEIRWLCGRFATLMVAESDLLVRAMWTDRWNNKLGIQCMIKPKPPP